MREQLLAAVQARLVRFTEDRDVDATLSGEALSDVTSLLAATPQPAADLEVLHAAGWLHWYRSPTSSTNRPTAMLSCASSAGKSRPFSRIAQVVQPSG